MAIEFLLKPKEEKPGAFILHQHFCTNPCFRRLVDDISHFSRQCLNLAGKIFELLLAVLGSIGIFQFLSGVKSPSFSDLFQFPAGLIALILVFFVPIISFVYTQVFGFILAQAENIQRPSFIRIILYSSFWCSIVLQVLVLSLFAWLLDPSAFIIGCTVWIGHIFWTSLIYSPLSLLLIFYLRKWIGGKRAYDPELRIWPPSFISQGSYAPFHDELEEKKKQMHENRDLENNNELEESKRRQQDLLR